MLLVLQLLLRPMPSTQDLVHKVLALIVFRRYEWQVLDSRRLAEKSLMCDKFDQRPISIVPAWRCELLAWTYLANCQSHNRSLDVPDTYKLGIAVFDLVAPLLLAINFSTHLQFQAFGIAVFDLVAPLLLAINFFHSFAIPSIGHVLRSCCVVVTSLLTVVSRTPQTTSSWAHGLHTS